MAQLFRPGADTLARIILLAIVLLPVAGVALAYGLRVSPYATDQNATIEQPVPFSHKHHVGDLGIDCRYCHTGVEKTAYAGLPSTQTCMTCHSQVWTNASVLQPVRDSWAKRQPIPWVRVNRLANYVYFDHSIHVAKGVGCSECHGAVHEMSLIRQATPMTMGWCLDCHRNPGPRLRPESAIFDTAWSAKRDDPLGPSGKTRADGYLAHYGIKDVAHLSDCSTCHR